MPKVIDGEMRFSSENLRELAGALLDKNVSFRIQAKGNSMSPVIKEGDIIVISPLKGKKPGCGDVLAYLNNSKNSLIVHRVVKKNGDHFHFRGDNSLESIETVTADHLLGRLSRVERKGKKIRFGLGPERVLIGFLNRNKGFAFLVRIVRQAYRLIPRRTG